MKNLSNELDKKSIKKMQIENFANLLKSIFRIKNSMIFYIDEAMNSKITKVAIIRFFNA